MLFLFNKNRKLKGWQLLIMVVLFLVTVSGCSLKIPYNKAAARPEPVTETGVAVPETPFEDINEETVQEPEQKINITLTGDIMVHSDQLAYAYDSTKKTYSFAGVLSEVAPILSAGDFTIGNLETTMAGRSQGYTGYPKFNSPEQLLPELKAAGFDLLVTSNNHSMDRKEYGVLQTIKHLDEAGLKHVGTYTSQDARNQMMIIEEKGIKTAILAYTYGTNGIPLPKGKGYLINFIDFPLIKKDIEKARGLGADLVLVYPHFGTEYKRYPNEKEKKLVEDLFAAGADLVIGSHPHVIQPMLRRDLANQTGLFCAYSMGNFISGQKKQYTDSGVILNLQLAREKETGKMILEKASYVPTWVHRYKEKGRTRIRVLPVEKAIRDYQEKRDEKISPEDYTRLTQVWQETTSMLSAQGLEIQHI